MRNRITKLLGIGFYLFGIVVSIAAGSIKSLPIMALLVGIGGILSYGVYYSEFELKVIEMREEYIGRFLDSFLFPSLLHEYEEVSSSECDIRANVMLLKRRDVFPWRTSNRTIPPWPWEKSLMIDFCTDGYDDTSERAIKWRVGEGVCGTTIEKAGESVEEDSRDQEQDEIWSDLEHTHIDEWDLTPKQYDETEHLGSVLSVPIYRPSDEEKDTPVGVLNLDSEENLSDTEFQKETVRKLAIKYANLIGALV